MADPEKKEENFNLPATSTENERKAVAADEAMIKPTTEKVADEITKEVIANAKESKPEKKSITQRWKDAKVEKAAKAKKDAEEAGPKDNVLKNFFVSQFHVCTNHGQRSQS